MPASQKYKNKKIAIYGMGITGCSAAKTLKKLGAEILCWDDNLKIRKKIKNFNFPLDKFWLNKDLFDNIVISPGIDINRCKIRKYLKKNLNKIITDLDLFFELNKNSIIISITGTNGKSTTSKLLYNVLKEHRKDVRLTGNIGNPTLLERGLKNNTLFVIEASSYQLEYSKYYRSEYSIILNLSPDHLERHGNFKNYIKAKFKLMQNQSKNNYAFIENNNNLFNNLIKKNKIKSKIFRVNYEKYQKYYELITNNYFKNKCNIKNLSFIFALSKNLKLSCNKIIKVTNKFKGLDFRQQIIYESKKLTIINDSKSTSLSATLPLLESFKNIYWILGGLAKKGDQLKLEKRYFGKIKAFIYGKDKVFFSKILSNKIKYKISKNLNYSLLLVFKDLRKRVEEKKIILFSPSAASFDQFNDFEDRGKYFNKIIKNYLKK